MCIIVISNQRWLIDLGEDAIAAFSESLNDCMPCVKQIIRWLIVMFHLYGQNNGVSSYNRLFENLSYHSF